MSTTSCSRCRITVTPGKPHYCDWLTVTDSERKDIPLAVGEFTLKTPKELEEMNRKGPREFDLHVRNDGIIILARGHLGNKPVEVKPNEIIHVIEKSAYDILARIFGENLRLACEIIEENEKLRKALLATDLQIKELTGMQN